MHQDTTPYQHYYPSYMAHRKATAEDVTLGAELTYDGIEDGYYWHGLVVGWTISGGEITAVELENDDTSEEHTIELRYLTVPQWGVRA